MLWTAHGGHMSASWAWKPPKGTKTPPRKIPDAAIPTQGNPRTTVPSFTGKTEQGETGGWGRGTGANVSDTMRGFNNAHDEVLAVVGGRINAHFKAKRKAKRA